ncbi:hypothetical protein M3P05_18470 [Sansalvadorimonas sp. 2012CJ34-2]|uniref:Uncharacterized protein n=1 Tax=Parendozoicomonas callyspongiae TaxID=2942213 RepID=A0ABT0PKJ5_9GAMM|nr:hypothetical protein [Sansalvadorimonas sp. 2012CJ34-2]MCL6271907.1 hypothetical protein [Sansalvadorimonas sp. 2012CJ34-2]
MQTSLLYIFTSIIFVVLTMTNFIPIISSKLLILNGLIICFIFEWFIRFKAFKPINKELNDNENRRHINYLWGLLSPGFYFSKYYKNEIEERSDEKETERLKSKIIKTTNNLNLISSAGIFLILTIIGLLKPVMPHVSFNTIVCISFGLVLYRTLSRSVEIIYAFTNDATSDETKSTSSLNKYDRIKLAINSYIENILNYAALYFLASDDKSNTLQQLFISIGRSTISSVNPVKSFDLINIAIYGQVITSLTLVVLSLAVYISRKT